MTQAAFQWTVDKDGRIVVPAEEVALHGLTPGEPFTIVEGEPTKSLSEIFKDMDKWRANKGIPELSEEEAERLAVDATRETRARIASEAGQPGVSP